MFLKFQKIPFKNHENKKVKTVKIKKYERINFDFCGHHPQIKLICST